MKKVLVIGFGNPGRLDDGLGPAFAERLEKLHLSNVTVDSDYQLNVEDAQDISQHDIVIFADAAMDAQEAYYFKKIEPKGELGFSSHSVEPEAVLAMAREMFGAKTEGYVLGIQGYEYNEFGEVISELALSNLEASLGFLVDKIRELQS